MFTFEYLAKSDFDEYAPRLFEILHRNMSETAPSGFSYEEDYISWTSSFGDAFKGREQRKIVLILSPEREIVGFFCFCALGDTLHMEEIQLVPACQGKHGVFRRLYRFVTAQLPSGLLYAEAYADKRNSKSLAVLGRLGLEVIGENESGSCYHLRGSFGNLLEWLNKTD